MIFVELAKRNILNVDENECIHAKISTATGLEKDDYYLIYNGKRLDDDHSETIANQTVYLVLRQVGGKGGFGSMLRAIGAQIEKTTNREACRDLSGRRLRDINEEKRLKNWIAKQPEREREALERKIKKIERLCSKPKHKFDDKEYEKMRAELTEIVQCAFEEGFKASKEKEEESLKRKVVEDRKKTENRKKRKLWIDADLDDLTSSDGSGDEENEDAVKTVECAKN